MPWLFGFAAGGAETWVPVSLGIGAIVYSPFSDYELGLVRKMPMRAHLALDAGSGAILPASLDLRFRRDRLRPHLVLGVTEIAVASATRTVPYESRTGLKALSRRRRD